MMNKIKLAVLVGTILAPIALILLLRKSNSKKENRWKQWMRPLIAVTFSILCILLFSKLTDILNQILDLPFMAPIKQWIQSGSGLTYGVVLYGAYLINILILIGYLIFKNTYRAFFGVTRMVVRFFIRLVFKNKSINDGKRKKAAIRDTIPDDIDSVRGPEKIYWHFLNLFYRIDDGSGVVRASWLTVCKTFLYACRILCVLYLALLLFAQLPILITASWYPYKLAQHLMESCYLWPAISAVMILEFAYYLEGNETFKTEREEEKEELQEEEKQPDDYTPLREVFRTEFPERYASSLNAITFPRVQEIPEPETELAKAIYERLHEWEELNHPIGKSILDCIASLPNRNNTVIDAQLSADFGECLMVYINILLARGDNLLVLCHNEETCEQIRDYIKSSLERINGLTPIWIVRTAEEAFQNGDCDVLIITPEMVLSETVINAQNRFFQNLTTILLIDISKMISLFGTLLTAAANRLETFSDSAIQYIALCNGMPDELRATLEQSFSPGNNFSAFECFSSDQKTRIMLWNYEPTGEGKVYSAQHNLFKSAMDSVFLGVAIPLACTAYKHHVDNISIMGNNLPIHQLIDAIRLNYSYMNFYFDATQTVDRLLDSIHFNTIDSSNPFIIAVDDTYNLPLTIHNYSRYLGSNSAMVHLISKPYMLRDYFADKASEFLRDKNKMEMLTTVIRDSPKATVMRLLFEASSENGLSEELLMHQLKKTGFEAESLREALEYCCGIIYDNTRTNKLEEYFEVRTISTFDRLQNEFVLQKKIRLKDSRLLKSLVREIQPAHIELEGRTISLGICCGNIFRYYLPDQAIVIAGRMYYIDWIDAKNGILYTGRMIENMSMPVDYSQHRKYTVLDIPEAGERKMVRELSFGQADEKQAEKCELELLRDVKIEVNTFGYMVSNPSFPFPDLTSKAQYRELGNSTMQMVRRTLEKGSVLALRFLGVNEEKCDRLSITLSVMMNEVMKTLFPYNWQCIAVCPVLHKIPVASDNGIPFENLALIYPQIQISPNKVTENGVAEILIIDDNDIDSGMLDALFSNQRDPLKNIFTILRDYLSWHQSFESKDKQKLSPDYLQFGAEEMPDFFDLKSVEELLKQMTTVYPAGIDWQDPTAKANCCYYCWKDLRDLEQSEYHMMKDEYGKNDRKVCNECFHRLVTDKQQMMVLYEQVKHNLCADYSIELPERIKVRFESAAKIRKSYQRKRKFRIIGLASSNNTIWVEKDSTPEHIAEIAAHELTHIWQYNNLQNEKMSIEDKEGHASYVEVEYMRNHGYPGMANRQENSLRQRNDEYGRGFIKLDDLIKQREDKNPFHCMKEMFG